MIENCWFLLRHHVFNRDGELSFSVRMNVMSLESVRLKEGLPFNAPQSPLECWPVGDARTCLAITCKLTHVLALNEMRNRLNPSAAACNHMTIAAQST